MAIAAGIANAQTTTQFAAAVTTPQGGMVLTGTGISPATGQPFRHLWSADATNGLCRLDPDIDTPGLHSLNPGTCIKTVVGGIAFSPGQLVFDPTTNDIYTPDSANKLGVFRLHFLPGGDSGHGLVDPTQQEVLGGLAAGGKADNCGIGANQPIALSLGPDGNLYLGFKRTGNIMRILSPQTEPLLCSNIQSQVAISNDLRTATGLAWIGHDLFGLDSRVPILFPNADQCFTPANGNAPCLSSFVGLTILGPGIVASDQTYPLLNGNTLFFGNSTTGVTRVANVANRVEIPTPGYGGSFSFLSALAVDTTNPANPVLFVGDDPSNGLVPGDGRWFQVSNAPLAPAPPAAPTGVTATAGNASATVGWTRTLDGQPLTSYTVHNSFASNSAPVPDVIVTAAPGSTVIPTGANITGLTNGISYQFEVLATNALGSSAFSAPSNTVTPQAPTVPGAPTGVSASALDAMAIVAWTAPASDGGSAITGYTVSALIGGTPSGITASVSGGVSGAVATGLTDGTTYTFTVHATNALGNGPESQPSNPVTPTPPPPPPPAPADLAVTLTGPASVDFGAAATYTINVANNGQSAAPQVIVTDTIPAIGSSLVSSTASQGVCTFSGATLTCNLGAMAAGSTAVITFTLDVLAQGTNQASAQARDAAGNLLADPTPGDNTASLTTTINGTKTTTDIQVTGSAHNGGPAAGTADFYTWQIKNGNNQVANDVVFANTLPSTLVFSSVSSNIGTCSGPAPGSLGGTVTCSAGTLAVGQTLVVTVNVIVPNAGTIATTGAATFNGTDINQANNSFTVTIQAK
jgi:uncharacterized repeat protein (TIGR01451 family)